MKKVRFASVLILLAMALAACSSGGNNEGTAYPGQLGTEAGVVGTEQVPVTGAETSTVAPTMEATKVATKAVTSTAVVGGVRETATSSVVTGEGLDDAYPNLFTELMNFTVVDSTCQEVGTVNGFVVSARNGQFVYLVLDSASNLNLDGQVLIPYEALDIKLNGSAGMGTSVTSSGSMAGTQTPSVRSTSTVGTAVAGACDAFDAGQAFMLRGITASQLDGFPVISSSEDLNTMVGTSTWDSSIRTFWQNLGVKVSNVPGANAGGSSSSSTGSATAVATATSGSSVSGTAIPGSMAGQEAVEVFISKPGDITVNGSDGSKVGNVQDLIVEPKSGKVTHVILSVGGFLGIGDRLVPVPWGALGYQFNEDNKLNATINADKTKLENAPGFRSLSEFPNTTSQGWDSEFNSYWPSSGSGS